MRGTYGRVLYSRIFAERTFYWWVRWMQAEDKDVTPESGPAKARADSEPTVCDSSAVRRSEFRRIVIWMVLLIGLSISPYLVGYVNSSQDWVFTGHLLPVPGDTCFHMSWAKQAYEGRLLFASQHNGAEAQTQLIFNVLFLVIGWTGRLLDMPLEMAWQLVRVGIAILLFAYLYHFTSYFIRDRTWKWFALVWITTSAGFGWLEMAGLPNWWSGPGADYVASAPIDTSVAEGSTYWYMQWEVVTTPTVLLLVAAFYSALRYFESGKTKYMIQAAVISILMGLVHPHNLMTIYGTLFLYLFVPGLVRSLSLSRQSVSWKPWILLMIVGAASAPTLLYYAYILRREPVLWNYVAAQYFFSPMQILTGFGLPGLFALYGTWVVLAKQDHVFHFLLAWITCGLLILYVPIPPAGRVHGIDGLHIAVCILGTRGLMQVVAWLQLRSSGTDLQTRSRRNLILSGSLASILVVSSLTNVLRMANEFTLTSRQGVPPFMTRLMAIGLTQHEDGLGIPYSTTSGSPYFLPGELRATCQWLDTHTNPSDVVLAPDYVGTFIPYLAGNRVYYGHGYVTPGMWDRQRRVERFYSFEQTDSARRAFLKSKQIAYVIFWSGDRVADDNSDTNRFVQSLEETHPLKLVYRNPRSLIFRATFLDEASEGAATRPADTANAIGRTMPQRTRVTTDPASRNSRPSNG